jgi:hypothetical protein
MVTHTAGAAAAAAAATAAAATAAAATAGQTGQIGERLGVRRLPIGGALTRPARALMALVRCISGSSAVNGARPL